MATLIVDESTDFRPAPDETGITRIYFRDLLNFDSVTATFNVSQFGVDRIRQDAEVEGGVAADTFRIILDGPYSHDFSAAAFTFVNWAAGDRLVIEGNSTGNDITGSSQADSILGGGGKDELFGGSGNDTLYGNALNDRLYGEGGDDYMAGGGENDRYYVDSAGDTVYEEAGRGIDSVHSSVDYVMPDNVERLYLTGTAFRAEGGAGGDTIQGNAAANLLKGHDGDDTISGGDGNDTLRGGEGRDRLDGQGGSNKLFGEQGVDYLVGGYAGHDTLNAGDGNDTMTIGSLGARAIGGAGDDWYFLVGTAAATTTIVEFAAGGSDSVAVNGSFSLAELPEIENLVLETGGTGTGNDADNRIGGSPEADTLIGGNGNDILEDIYHSSATDRLIGGAGADTMRGGPGADVYVDPVLSGPESDMIEEEAEGGVDTAESATSISIASVANLENVVLTGTAESDATGNAHGNRLTGNDAANSLYGEGAGDTMLGKGGGDRLDGGIGNDTLDGGDGSDTLIGGAGDDLYTNFNQTNDTIIEEAGGGVDTIRSRSGVRLELINAEVERVELVGTAAADAGGNNIANTLVGNNAANRLLGYAGNDTLVGAAGEDTLIGGKGDDLIYGGTQADLFQFATSKAGDDRIEGFESTLDRFSLSGGGFADVTEEGGDTVLRHAGGTIRVAGVTGLSLDDWNALVVGTARAAGPDPGEAADMAAMVRLEQALVPASDFV